MSNFSPEVIFQTLNNYFNQNREHEALVYLFETLIDELPNIENCNNFLIFGMSQKMNSDVIVHILNALSPIKLKLTQWAQFREYCLNLLIQEVGTDQAFVLISALDSV